MMAFLRKYRFLVGFLLGGVLVFPFGFALGVYMLPILVAEEGAQPEKIEAAQLGALRTGELTRSLKGSDALHWGEGQLILSKENGIYYFTLKGEVSPGPDYRLYLAPKWAEDEASFQKIKQSSIEVARLGSFRNFRVAVPSHIDPLSYPYVVIWCERFSQFITATALK